MTERDELIEALSGMVQQHCYLEKDGRYSSGCLHANADAMRILGKVGEMEIDDRGGRIVFAKIIPKPPEFAEIGDDFGRT